MRRLFWVAVGATGAVVAVRRLERTARRYSPAGVAERVEQAGERAGAAVDGALARFRTAQTEREQELVRTLLVTPEAGDPHAVLGRDRRRRVEEDAAWSTGSAAPRPDGAARAAARPSGRVDEDEPLYDF